MIKLSDLKNQGIIQLYENTDWNIANTVQFIVYYYLATPFFMLVDMIFNWHIRIPYLNNPAIEWFYYAGLIVCALICYSWPRFSPLVTLFESSINILLLLLSVMIPLLMLPGEYIFGELTNAGTIAAFNTSVLFNFLFISSILIFSVQTSIKNLHGRLF